MPVAPPPAPPVAPPPAPTRLRAAAPAPLQWTMLPRSLLEEHAPQLLPSAVAMDVYVPAALEP